MKRKKIQLKFTNLILNIKDLILLVSIRLGKTKISLDAIEEDESVLVVYPLIQIKKGWDEDIIKFPPKSNNITFTTTTSLKKYKDQYFDYLILDEPQLYSKAQRDIVKSIKYKKRVALTGTLKPSTKSKLKQELNLEVKAEYSLDNAINDGLVKDYKIYVHIEDLNNTNKNCRYKKFGNEVVGTEKEAYDFYYKGYLKGFKNEITDFIYNSITLYKLAHSLCLRFKDQKTLLYSMRTIVLEDLVKNTYTSKNKNKILLEEFKLSKSGHLGVVNKVQAGVTFYHLDKVIFHSAEANTEKIQQKIGRSLLYDFEDNYSEIHICCLKDTIQERWINLGLSSLNQNKITYIYNNKEYTKLEWVKFNNPGKELYQYYNGGICYLVDEEQKAFSNYCFIDNPNNKYSLLKEKLIKI